MKLNFWQWLGVVLLVLGGIYYYYGHYMRKTPEPMPATTPAPMLQTAPTSRPAV